MRFAIVCSNCFKEQVWYGNSFKFILPHNTAEHCPWCKGNTYLDITTDETPHENEIKGITLDVPGNTTTQTGQKEG